MYVQLFCNRHAQFVWTFASLLARQLNIASPPRNTDVASRAHLISTALQGYTPAAFVPTNKEVVTYTSVAAKPKAPVKRSSPLEFNALLTEAVGRLDIWSNGKHQLNV